MAVLGPATKQNRHTHYSDRDVQILQMWIERICNYISVLEGNVEVVTSLASFYDELLGEDDFPFRTACRGDIVRFKREVKSIADNFRMQISRANALLLLVRDRKELVDLTNIAASVRETDNRLTRTSR